MRSVGELALCVNNLDTMQSFCVELFAYHCLQLIIDRIK